MKTDKTGWYVLNEDTGKYELIPKLIKAAKEHEAKKEKKL